MLEYRQKATFQQAVIDNTHHLGDIDYQFQMKTNITMIQDDIYLKHLEQFVRFGTKPDDPDLLFDYLQHPEVMKSEICIDCQRALYQRQFQTLLEVFCDHCVPEHWRHLCLDSINRPLLALHRLALSNEDWAQIYQFKKELMTLNNYFNHNNE